ncbi:ribosomal protein S18-alanine N-acetyltransferase [Polycladidibacter hongkongensis]|uniref:ribosomal protein S18-alanine N-acetyltransferase n=1 Tax=Polycladidibacter hongkongensis TaxID=1647556 RepID=UPI00082C1E0C|nr:ribosomal protein S18-alanine N-acetyltransferase [Pseudovibrio hongkongensis]
MKLLGLFSKPPVIRSVSEEDIPAMAKAHAACFSHNWNSAELRGILPQKGTFALAAWQPQVLMPPELVGFVIIRNIVGEAEVLTVAVLPSKQGRGIGRQLMDAAIFQLQADRAETLFLEVDDANTPAVALYKKLGFKQIGERKGYYAASEGAGTALVMRCDLR